MNNKLPLIAWAALPLTIGAALAAQPQRIQPAPPAQSQSGQVQPTPNTPGIPQGQNQQGQPQQGQRGQGQLGQQRQDSGTNYADVFLQKLAAQLGITVDKLRAAAVAAGGATIDQGVQAGDIPSDRAAEMKSRLNDQPFTFGGGRGMGGHGHGMGRMDDRDRGEHGRGERGPRGHHMDDDGAERGGYAQDDESDDTNAQSQPQDGTFSF